MSLVGDRAAIAAALSIVDGVEGFEYRPAAPRVGDGWPIRGRRERAGGRSFETTWRVLVALPSDERQASAWMDAHEEALIDAMEERDVGYVDATEPVEVATSGGPMLALQITMRSE